MAIKNGDSTFLVIYRAYENAAVSHEEEHRAFRLSMEKFGSKQNPRISALFGMAGKRGSVTLYQGSVVELHHDLMKDPSMRLGDVEIIPLVSEAEMAKGLEASILEQEGSN
jgi:hypothetical protein